MAELAQSRIRWVVGLIAALLAILIAASPAAAEAKAIHSGVHPAAASTASPAGTLRTAYRYDGRAASCLGESAGEALAASRIYTYDGEEISSVDAFDTVPRVVAAGRAPSVLRSAEPLDAPTASSRAFVATEAGTDLVRYDPEWASRQMLDQNTPGSSGYGVTPGGRTVSAHAAERVSVGGPGRPPTSLSTVDEILDTGTSVRYDPIRDSIQVRAPQMPGKPYVVVDSGGTHIVTVMVPK